MCQNKNIRVVLWQFGPEHRKRFKARYSFLICVSNVGNKACGTLGPDFSMPYIRAVRLLHLHLCLQGRRTTVVALRRCAFDEGPSSRRWGSNPPALIIFRRKLSTPQTRGLRIARGLEPEPTAFGLVRLASCRASVEHALANRGCLHEYVYICARKHVQKTQRCDWSKTTFRNWR